MGHPSDRAGTGRTAQGEERVGPRPRPPGWGALVQGKHRVPAIGTGTPPGACRRSGPQKEGRSEMRRRPRAVNGADSVDRSAGAAGNRLPTSLARPRPDRSSGGGSSSSVRGAGLSPAGARERTSPGAQGSPLRGRWLQFSRDPGSRLLEPPRGRPAAALLGPGNKAHGGPRLGGSAASGPGQSPSGPRRWAQGGPGAAVTLAWRPRQGPEGAPSP